MAQTLREVFEGHHDGGMFSPVEIDEVYIGGKNKNMSLSRRRKVYETGKRYDTKTGLAGVKDRATNQIKAQVVGRVDGDAMRSIVSESTDKDAMVYTD